MSAPSQFNSLTAHERFPQERQFSTTAFTSIYNIGQVEPRLTTVEFFEFTDTSDNIVTPTGGTVTLSCSIDGDKNYHILQENSNFNAADASSITRQRPRHEGIIDRLRLEVSGLVISPSTFKIRFLLLAIPI